MILHLEALAAQRVVAVAPDGGRMDGPAAHRQL